MDNNLDDRIKNLNSNLKIDVNDIISNIKKKVKKNTLEKVFNIEEIIDHKKNDLNEFFKRENEIVEIVLEKIEVNGKEYYIDKHGILHDNNLEMKGYYYNDKYYIIDEIEEKFKQLQRKLK